MNIHQTRAHAQFLESIGWKVIEHKYRGKETWYFLRKFPLLPVYFLKIQRLPLELIDWDLIERLQKENRVIETVIEIDGNDNERVHQVMEQHGFKLAADFMLTTKTRLIDLSKDALQLIKEMKPKTRYNLKKCQKMGLLARVVELEKVVNNKLLFDEYFQLLKDNAKRVKMLLIPKDWIRKQWTAFGKNGFVVEVRENQSLVALALFYCSDDTCSYNLNGSTSRGRKVFGPTLAVWEGIIEGKRRKKQWLDFDGVYDERFMKSQSRFVGFGKFKAGFGGQTLTFPPMFRKRAWKNLFDLW